MTDVKITELLSGIVDEDSKGLEVISLAAHLESRYGIRFMQKTQNAFCKFTVSLAHAKGDGKSDVKVSIFVLTPDGAGRKSTRFSVYVTRSWALKDPLKFCGLTTQQVFNLLDELSNRDALIYRIFGIGLYDGTERVDEAVA